MISFDCQCGKPFKFSFKFKGREFRCNMCGRPLVVPEESIASDPTGKKQLASVGKGETITPVKPVLQIDVGALPKALQSPSATSQPQPVQKVKEAPPKKVVPPSRPAIILNDDDDDIVISGNLSKVDDDHFHVDIDITPTEDEPIEVEVVPEEPTSKPAKKSGIFGFGAKKEKPTKSEPAPKQPKSQKKAEKPTQPQPVVEVSEEAPAKKSGIFGFGAKKEKPAKPKPAPKQPKAQKQPEKPTQPQPIVEVSEEASAKKSGFFGRGSKKEKPVQETPQVAAPPVKAAPKEKPVKPEKAAKSDSKKKSSLLTTCLLIIYPLALVVLGAMLYLEKGKTAEEVKKVQSVQSQLDSVRKELNELKAKETSAPPTEPTTEPTTEPLTNNSADSQPQETQELLDYLSPSN